jgi:hypothetical protein
MRLELSFWAVGPWSEGSRRVSLRTPTLPMDIALESYGRYRLEGGEREAEDGEGRRISISMVAERRIERPDEITIVDDLSLDADAFEEEEPRKLAKASTSPEVDQLTEGARLVAAALSFAIGAPLTVHPQLFERNLLIDDDEEDRRLLDRLGTDRVRISHTFADGTEVFDDCEVDAELVGELARRGAVGVYADAMRAGSAVARFRELWRTLEIAFQAHGKQLTDLIAEFPPARELGFDREELDALLVLRGQISHASSRLGVRDVSQFEREATLRLGRLWTLVDRIILTKKDASRALEVDELRPLYAHVWRDGFARLDVEDEDAEYWFGTFGTRSERFH